MTKLRLPRQNHFPPPSRKVEERRVLGFAVLQLARVECAADSPALHQRTTATPTAVALLAAIARAEITLTQWQYDGQTASHLTALPDLLLEVLRYLHLPLTLYTGLGKQPLAENSGFDISIFGK